MLPIFMNIFKTELSAMVAYPAGGRTALDPTKTPPHNNPFRPAPPSPPCVLIRAAFRAR